MFDLYDYMTSAARLDRIQPGAVVEATVAAPEWCYGRTGQVLRIRRPAEWQTGIDAPAVLVRWSLGVDDAGRIIGRDRKHALTEIKLRDGEEWDVYGDYPLPPEPDMEQMRMEI